MIFQDLFIVQGTFEIVLRKLSGCFKSVLRLLQENFLGVALVSQGSVKDDLWKFQWFFRIASEVLKVKILKSFKQVSRLCQGSFKGGCRKNNSKVLPGSFKNVSIKCQGVFKEFQRCFKGI